MKRFRPAGPRQNTSHQVLTVRTSKPHWRLLLPRCFVKLTLCTSVGGAVCLNPHFCWGNPCEVSAQVSGSKEAVASNAGVPRLTSSQRGRWTALRFCDWASGCRAAPCGCRIGSPILRACCGENLRLPRLANRVGKLPRYG